MQPVFGAKVGHLHVYLTLTIFLAGVSKAATQVMETMREHPELLGESFIFFPRLYHIYHLPFRLVSVRARVYQLLRPYARVPCLTHLAEHE